MEEEDAFVVCNDTRYTLADLLCGLVGHHVDQAVLVHFVKEYFPELSQKLEKLHSDSCCDGGWMMPIFINTLR